jgi:hypothetical protein
VGSIHKIDDYDDDDDMDDNRSVIKIDMMDSDEDFDNEDDNNGGKAKKKGRTGGAEKDGVIRELDDDEYGDENGDSMDDSEIEVHDIVVDYDRIF